MGYTGFRTMTRILIAEDDTRIAANIQALLAAESHAAVVAHSGIEGIQLLKAGQFDLVITDLMMEEGTGLDILEWARTNAPGLPVIICSSYARPEALRSHLDGLRSRILRKPFETDELLRVVGELLQETGRAPGKGAP